MSEMAYLSLGSNMGPRQENLRGAIERLKSLGRVASISSFYETAPMEFTDQPWFVNCAVALETSQSPAELMNSVLGIEEAMGRRRTLTKGPRTIDIDILLFGDRVVDAAELKIPHPAMHERRFVLEPLQEIAPEAPHPLLQRTVRELRNSLPGGQVVKKLRNIW